MNIAYPKTVITGNKHANAIIPKPSKAGFLSGIVLDNPMPIAATTGTVTVEVVTPPTSYANGTNCFGAKTVRISTII